MSSSTAIMLSDIPDAEWPCIEFLLGKSRVDIIQELRPPPPREHNFTVELPIKKKRKRTSVINVSILEYVYENITQFPSVDLREELSKRTGMTQRAIQIWFQNRRAKIKRQKKDKQQAK